MGYGPGGVVLNIVVLTAWGIAPRRGSDTDTLGVSNQAFCGSKAAQDTHGVHQGGMVGVVHSLLWSLRSKSASCGNLIGTPAALHVPAAHRRWRNAGVAWTMTW